MKKLLDWLVSTRMAALLLVIYAVAMAVATFIENDYGTPASKALVYNARWFEIIQVLLCLNFLANIKRYRLFSWKKLPILLFHISFVIILVGAGVTRYISFEGQMPIQEGQSSDVIISDQTYFKWRIDDNALMKSGEVPSFFSTLDTDEFHIIEDFKGKTVRFDYVRFVPKAIDTVFSDPNGKKALKIVLPGDNGRDEYYLEQGKSINADGFPISYDLEQAQSIEIKTINDSLYFRAPVNANYMVMATQANGFVEANTWEPLKLRALYRIGNKQLVFPEVVDKVRIDYISSKLPKDDGKEDVLIVDISVDNEKKRVALKGGKGQTNPLDITTLNGLNIYTGHGSNTIKVPFSIQLRDFELERYPGSNSPASYASELTIIDGEYKADKRVFMNNILDYKGYRFFQSSYFPDEKGTILSVNHDFWGTWITYLGYMLMMLSMTLTLFWQGSRYKFLSRVMKEIQTKKTSLILLFLLSIGLNAQRPNENFYKNLDSLINTQKIDHQHADKFGKLMVQDFNGRLKPMNTLASEFVRKIHKEASFKDLKPEEVILGLYTDPIAWQFIPFVKITGKKDTLLKSILGVTEEHASFIDFMDKDGNYKLNHYVEEANRKAEKNRNEFDKNILDVNRRIELFYAGFSAELLRTFPLPNDSTNTWYSFVNQNPGFEGRDSLIAFGLMPQYFHALNYAKKNNDYAHSDTLLSAIAQFQKIKGKDIYPTQNKIDFEVAYNNSNIFYQLFLWYQIISTFFILFYFVHLFWDKKWSKYIVNIMLGATLVLFAIHTAGLIVRWYISGHAPWSNGYESMLYVAWATMLAGITYMTKNKLVTAATSFMAGMILLIAHWNYMDPEINNLEPVLNSYWLMIHVALIVASYGPFTLGFILGILVLILYCINNTQRKTKIDLLIKELSVINEMNLTLGLFMLAVGTFLGGMWANESWGRYWGWDPKETWAFISVIVYAFVLHMRLVPGLKGYLALAVASVFSFASILMTYFGVNFYLSGLHSYAKGDPVPIPTYVPILTVVLILLSIFAYYRKKSLEQ